jgi:uncharacterized protein (TIGR02246 family)
MNAKHLTGRVWFVGVCLMLVVALVAACAPVQPLEVSAQAAAEPDVEAVSAEIEAAFDEYAASLNAGDVERWIQLWTEDGVQSPPNTAPRFGRDTILAAISAAAERIYWEDFEIDIEEVLVAGDLAIARGMYTVTNVPKDGSAPIPVDGKYTSTFQRQPDGSWKLYRDIFNSNVPPAAPAEPDMEEVTAEVEAFFTEYAASLNAGDADRYIQLWMEEGVQLPPDAPPNVGRDTIYAGQAAEFEQVAYEDMAIQVEDVMASGDMVVARGTYALSVVPKDGSEPIPVDGKYMSVLKRQPDGSLKLYRDIFNSNVPPAAPAEPDMEEVAAQVQAFWDEYSAANVAGDAERWIALWEEDGVKMVEGAPPFDIEGKENILASKQASLARAIINEMTITNQEVEVGGDLAFVRGVFDLILTPVAGGDSVHFDGKYMSILKQQPDGSWKLYRDMMNSNEP